MSEEELDREVLGRLGIDRRDFVKRALRAAAFTAPVVASFDMSVSLAQARKRSRDAGPSVKAGPAYFSNGGPAYFPNGYAGHSDHYFPYDRHHGNVGTWGA